MKAAISIIENHGGLSTDRKQGVNKSFAYARHVDFRKSPTQMSILPKTVKESSTTVTGLITQMIQLPSGKMVAIDDAGGVYTRSTGGTWTKNGTTVADTGAGMSYNLQQDTIYIPGLTTMHSITNADGRFSGGTFTVNSDAFGALVDQVATDSSATYTTTGSVTETATNILSVTPEREPMYSIKLWVTTKGTGDVTVTMHDGANNKLAEVTKTAASLTNGALNEFVFTTPVRNTVAPNAATYHFHVTHSGGTASTIGTGTASDFSDARFETYADRFVSPINTLRPTIDFLQYMVMGNERYLAVWEPISQSDPEATEFLQHRLVFPSGYEVTSLANWNEYVAIGCEKRSTSATNEFQDGKIFFWDGVSTTYNFFIDVPEGSPYSLFSSKNVLYYICAGALWAWAQGQPSKVFQIPNTDTEFGNEDVYMVNLPNMMAVRNGILLFGFPSITSSTAIEHGIYSFGSRNKNYSESVGFSYTSSDGTITNATAGTLELGMVRSFGDKTFLSWKDDTTYGVDIIDPDSDPFATATWQSLIYDNGRPDKTKEAVKYFIDTETLPTGATVTPKYKIDRGSWVNGTAIVAGDTQAVLSINKRFKEIEIGWDAVATTATPKILASTLIVELLDSEKD